MKWSSTISTLLTGTEADIEYYKPFTNKIAVLCKEDHAYKGYKEVDNGTLFVYMYDMSDYKGDVFDSISLGLKKDKTSDEFMSFIPKELKDFPEETLELYDYLVSTGKVINA